MNFLLVCSRKARTPRTKKNTQTQRKRKEHLPPFGPHLEIFYVRAPSPGNRGEGATHIKHLGLHWGPFTFWPSFPRIDSHIGFGGPQLGGFERGGQKSMSKPCFFWSNDCTLISCSGGQSTWVHHLPHFPPSPSPKQLIFTTL